MQKNILVEQLIRIVLSQQYFGYIQIKQSDFTRRDKGKPLE